MGKTLSYHYFFRNVLVLSVDSGRVRQDWASSIRDFSWWGAVTVNCSRRKSRNRHDHDLFRIVSFPALD